MSRTYLTTTLPYVNADPHLGHALEFVHADIIARYKRLAGEEVFLNTGTDEHGQKVYKKALEEGQDPKVYVDTYAERFKSFISALNISEHNFIRTTDPHHVAAAQEFWKRCEERGDIYKKAYQIKYCVGCELEKTDSELEDGKCPIHPTTPIENIDEENYFFKFSAYQEKLLSLYANNPNFVIPETRLNEIHAFVERGLVDFSISRLKTKMPWGVEVPGDPEHVMYVWFDALVNYIAAIGWPEDQESFSKWWPVTQFAGKDNLRQQAAMWQAMLLSAGIEPSRQIVIHGFITSQGQKMSKSVGNTVNPLDIVGEYGVDALRYFLAREISPFEDGDFTSERFKEAYNANLANGLGNLVARIMKMSESYLGAPVAVEMPKVTDFNEYATNLDAFEISKAADYVWEKIGKLDAHIQKTEPFKLYKEDKDKACEIVEELVRGLADISVMLAPIMPETFTTIQQAIKTNTPPNVLFPRK